MTKQHDAPEGGTSHDLYKTGDVGAPDTIKDRNGEVVLGLCKRCGKAEVELSEPCIASTPPAPSGLVDAETTRPFPNAQLDHDASSTITQPRGSTSTNAEPAATKNGSDGLSTFERWHIEKLVREWVTGPGFVPAVKPHLINGLVHSLRLRLDRADDATLSGQQGGAVPDEDAAAMMHRLYMEKGGKPSEKLREAVAFYRKWERDSGAVPAGDLRPGLEEAIHVLATRAEECRIDNLHSARRALTLGEDILRARLAEQPAPAGTGEADRVEGLRPGLEKALEIIKAETETMSSLSPGYARLQAIVAKIAAAGSND